MNPAVCRGELTETAWERIAPLLPRTDGRGRPWRDHRQVINGVLWRLRTGTPWRDVPVRYGPWQTIYERFARWETDGTWAKLLEHVQVHQDAAGTVKWTISVAPPSPARTSMPPGLVQQGHQQHVSRPAARAAAPVMRTVLTEIIAPREAQRPSRPGGEAGQVGGGMRVTEGERVVVVEYAQFTCAAKVVTTRSLAPP